MRAFQEKANLHRKEAVGAPREESVSEKSEQNEAASYMLRIEVYGCWTLESERHSMPTQSRRRTRSWGSSRYAAGLRPHPVGPGWPGNASDLEHRHHGNDCICRRQEYREL